MKLVLISSALAAAISLASTGPVGAEGKMAHMSSMKMMSGMSVNVTMNEQNGSGENGTAMLHDTAKGLVVTIHIKNAKGPQPVHIHKGTCAKLDPKPAYALHNVVNGMSTTTVPGVTIAQLEKSPFAINAHKSLTDIPTYVSCGDIKK